MYIYKFVFEDEVIFFGLSMLFSEEHFEGNLWELKVALRVLCAACHMKTDLHRVTVTCFALLGDVFVPPLFLRFQSAPSPPSLIGVLGAYVDLRHFECTQQNMAYSISETNMFSKQANQDTAGKKDTSVWHDMSSS